MKLPPELKRSLHPLFSEWMDLRVTLPFFAFLLLVLVYGSITYPNGWIRYAPPAFGSFSVGLFLFARPWNPYRSLYAKWQGIRSEADVESDLAAQRLLTKLRSHEGRCRVLAYALAAPLFYDLLIWTSGHFTSPPSRWSFSAQEVASASLLWAFVSIGVLNCLMLHWVVATWKLEN